MVLLFAARGVGAGGHKVLGLSASADVAGWDGTIYLG